MSTNPLVKAIVHRMSDPEWLSEQLGYPARATSLRIKPGTSVTASVVERSDDDGDVLGDRLSANTTNASNSAVSRSGWARVLWSGNEGKARKLQLSAAKRGLDVRDSIMDGALLFQRGSVFSDPKLMKILGTLNRVNPHQQVLRFNPERRLVIRSASPVPDTTSGADSTPQTSTDSVLRITAQPNPVSAELYEALAQHVSLPARLDDGSNPHLCELVFVQGGDLLASDATSSHLETLARDAGTIFAQLHASAAALPAGLTAELHQSTVDPCAQALAHVELFDIMDPLIADRLRGIIRRVEPHVKGFFAQAPVLVHGDASPDQVLVGDRMYLTDLDRLHFAPAAVDIGSYLAVASEQEGQAFLEGYESACSVLTMPSARDIALATAMSLITRLAGPLRTADPEWHATTQTMLTDVDRLLTRVEKAGATTTTAATTPTAGRA